jgi:hypothetical protein
LDGRHQNFKTEYDQNRLILSNLQKTTKAAEKREAVEKRAASEKRAVEERKTNSVGLEPEKASSSNNNLDNSNISQTYAGYLN